jgi:hypothetical protein
MKAKRRTPQDDARSAIHSFAIAHNERWSFARSAKLIEREVEVVLLPWDRLIAEAVADLRRRRSGSLNVKLPPHAEAARDVRGRLATLRAMIKKRAKADAIAGQTIQLMAAYQHLLMAGLPLLLNEAKIIRWRGCWLSVSPTVYGLLQTLADADELPIVEVKQQGGTLRKLLHDARKAVKGSGWTLLQRGEEICVRPR